MKTVGVASEGAQLIASGLSTEVVETILQSRALDTYVHRAAPWRKVDQLLICYGPLKRGLPASKQALSRGIVEAINMSYESSDLPSLFRPLALDVLHRDTHWAGTGKSGSVGISFP